MADAVAVAVGGEHPPGAYAQAVLDRPAGHRGPAPMAASSVAAHGLLEPDGPDLS